MIRRLWAEKPSPVSVMVITLAMVVAAVALGASIRVVLAVEAAMFLAAMVVNAWLRAKADAVEADGR